MIVIYIALWLIISIISAGIMIYDDPEEWGGDDACLAVLLNVIGCWVIFLVLGIVVFVFRHLGNLAMWVAGFITGVTKSEEVT